MAQLNHPGLSGRKPRQFGERIVQRYQLCRAFL
jgi:hypothetical protein